MFRFVSKPCRTILCISRVFVAIFLLFCANRYMKRAQCFFFLSKKTERLYPLKCESLELDSLLVRFSAPAASEINFPVPYSVLCGTFMYSKKTILKRIGANCVETIFMQNKTKATQKLAKLKCTNNFETKFNRKELLSTNMGAATEKNTQQFNELGSIYN